MGVDALDDDHRKLIGTMNDVFDGLLQGNSAAATRPAMASLRRYVEEHFAREEAWMLEHAPARLEEHKVEHQRIREQVDRLQTLHSETDDQVAVELLMVLRDWLIGHIAGRDVRSVPASAPATGRQP